jgi:hypothetical protein
LYGTLLLWLLLLLQGLWELRAVCLHRLWVGLQGQLIINACM